MMAGKDTVILNRQCIGWYTMASLVWGDGALVTSAG